MVPVSAHAETTLSNDALETRWNLAPGSFNGTVLYRPLGQQITTGKELFSLVLTDGTYVPSTTMSVVSEPKEESLPAQPGASRYSDRLPGKKITAELTSNDGNLHVTWSAKLREGSHYVQQEITLLAKEKSIALKGILMLDFPLNNAASSGALDGSPAITDTMFFGVEHPMSVNRGELAYVRCFLPRATPLEPGEPFSVSSVIGFVTKGQLRREFLAYLERERAHPYRPFLNYNTWYDIGYFSRFDAAAACDAINSFGQELVVKRKTHIDSFLLDDGWDDPKSLWRPHKGFPEGFAPVAAMAKKYGAALGFWLSPWGGYGGPKEERLRQGREEGFEIANGSFSMAGPKFYERFRGLCLDVVKNQGANHFKFDGIGNDSGEGAGEQIRDLEAMLRLLAELRRAKADLYINQTTGTWPSPFWLLHADSIWRGGEDHSFAGTGSDRQQWITYRDSDVYARIVARTKLYPLNSLMLHGMIFARHANKLNVDPKNDFPSEVRSFFGSGTQMQEMYITPKLLSPANWDALSAAARWSRENADVLVDTHWVGGDPSEMVVYGWASWSPRKGILTLRNPSGHKSQITIDAAKVFELPESASKKYKLTSPYADQRATVTELVAGKEATFELQPYEVLVFDAAPVKE
jgi:hypothetical protein